MARKTLPKFQLADTPLVFTPVFEHFGDPKGPGDLFVGWYTTGQPCEEDRATALGLCRRAEGSFTSIGAARSALEVARRQAEAA